MEGCGVELGQPGGLWSLEMGDSIISRTALFMLVNEIHNPLVKIDDNIYTDLLELVTQEIVVKK